MDDRAQAMERRFEAYKHKVVRPFFNEHFVRLDRSFSDGGGGGRRRAG